MPYTHSSSRHRTEPIIRYFVPKDAKLVRNALSKASRLSKKIDFKKSHINAASHTAHATALSLLNSPIYIVRGIGKAAKDIKNLDPDQLFSDLTTDFKEAGKSFLSGTLGVFFTTSVFFFPKESFKFIGPVKSKKTEKTQRLRIKNKNLHRSLKKAKTRVEKKLTHQKKKIKQLHHSHESHLRSCRKEIKSLKNSPSSEDHETLSKKLKDRSQTLEKSRARITRLEKRLTAAEQREAALQTQLNTSLKEEQEASASDHERLSRHLREVTEECETLQMANAELEEAITTVREREKKLAEELEALRKEEEDKLVQLEKAQASSFNEKKPAKNRKRNNPLEKARKKITELEKELERIKAEQAKPKVTEFSGLTKQEALAIDQRIRVQRQMIKNNEIIESINVTIDALREKTANLDKREQKIAALEEEDLDKEEMLNALALFETKDKEQQKLITRIKAERKEFQEMAASCLKDAEDLYKEKDLLEAEKHLIKKQLKAKIEGKVKGKEKIKGDDTDVKKENEDKEALYIKLDAFQERIEILRNIQGHNIRLNDIAVLEAIISETRAALDDKTSPPISCKFLLGKSFFSLRVNVHTGERVDLLFDLIDQATNALLAEKINETAPQERKPRDSIDKMSSSIEAEADQFEKLKSNTTKVADTIPEVEEQNAVSALQSLKTPEDLTAFLKLMKVRVTIRGIQVDGDLVKDLQNMYASNQEDSYYDRHKILKEINQELTAARAKNAPNFQFLIHGADIVNSKQDAAAIFQEMQKKIRKLLNKENSSLAKEDSKELETELALGYLALLPQKGSTDYLQKQLQKFFSIQENLGLTISPAEQTDLQDKTKTLRSYKLKLSKKGVRFSTLFALKASDPESLLYRGNAPYAILRANLSLFLREDPTWSWEVDEIDEGIAYKPAV